MFKLVHVCFHNSLLKIRGRDDDAMEQAKDYKDFLGIIMVGDSSDILKTGEVGNKWHSWEISTFVLTPLLIECKQQFVPDEASLLKALVEMVVQQIAFSVQFFLISINRFE